MKLTRLRKLSKSDFHNWKLWKSDFLILLAVLVFATCAGAQSRERNYEKEKVVIPPGMELKKVGDVNLLYPKGASVDTGKPGFIYVGQEDVYAAKKFLEMENRFDKIEEKEANLEKAIGDLKKRIDNIEGNIKETEKPASESPPREESQASALE